MKKERNGERRREKPCNRTAWSLPPLSPAALPPLASQYVRNVYSYTSLVRFPYIGGGGFHRELPPRADCYSPHLLSIFVQLFTSLQMSTWRPSIAVLIAIRIILATCKSERKRLLRSLVIFFSPSSLCSLPFSTRERKNHRESHRVYQYIIPFSCRPQVLLPRVAAAEHAIGGEPALKIFRNIAFRTR